jgi:hypothetical protein
MFRSRGGFQDRRARQFGPLLSRASWGSSFVGQLQRLEKGITRI